MSRGKNLQEMEVKTQQSKTAANANAKPGDPMPSLSGTTPGQTGSYEDLGGPTPENYKTDDDSAKLKTPGSTLKQVRDVVNKKAKPGDPAPAGMKEEEVEIEEPVIEEETTDEVVAEEETTETVEYNVEEDVNALLGGEELSEEFKEKAKTIFEAAINAKLLLFKKKSKHNMLPSSLKKLRQRKNHSQSVLILILSMSLTSGLKKTHLPLRQASRLK